MSLIHKVEMAVNATKGFTVKRKLKTKIELDSPYGLITFKNNPRTLHIEFWDGITYHSYDDKTGLWYNSTTKGKWGRRITKDFWYDPYIDSVVFQGDLMVLNGWIALKMGV